jgi:hypothetical protein
LTKGIDDNPGTQSDTFPTISEIRITVHMTYMGADDLALVLAIGALVDVVPAAPFRVFPDCLNC